MARTRSIFAASRESKISRNERGTSGPTDHASGLRPRADVAGTLRVPAASWRSTISSTDERRRRRRSNHGYAATPSAPFSPTPGGCLAGSSVSQHCSQPADRRQGPLRSKRIESGRLDPARTDSVCTISGIGDIGLSGTPVPPLLSVLSIRPMPRTGRLPRPSTPSLPSINRGTDRRVPRNRVRRRSRGSRRDRRPFPPCPFQCR